MKNLSKNFSEIFGTILTKREAIIISGIVIIFTLSCLVEVKAANDEATIPAPAMAMAVSEETIGPIAMMTSDDTTTEDESIHITNLEDGAKVIREEDEYAVVYDSSDGNVSFWSFGELQNEYTVPEGAVYEGLSYWEGDIFHKEGDVYSLRGEGSHMPDDSVTVIAHNVKEVLDTDYDATMDDFSQPLFLMEDGSKKFYTSYYGKDLPTDDASHLKQPME